MKIVPPDKLVLRRDRERARNRATCHRVARTAWTGTSSSSWRTNGAGLCALFALAALSPITCAVTSAVAGGAGQSGSIDQTMPGKAAPDLTAPPPSAPGNATAPTKKRPADGAAGGAPGGGPGGAPGAKSIARNLVGHGGPVKALAIAPDGRYALTGSFDYAMMLWDISRSPPSQVARYDAHEGAVNAVAFVPGGKFVVAAGDDGSVWLWHRLSAKLRHRFTGHVSKINHLSVSADGRFAVSSSWDRTARVWDLEKMVAGPVLRGHKGPVNAAQFSADGREVYTASYDGSIGLWDRASGQYQRRILKVGWGVNVLLRLPGSEHLLWGALNGTAGIIDASSGKTITTLPSHERPVLSAASIAKPGLIATGGGGGVIRVMRIGDWAVIEEYQNSLGPIWALDFIPGGKQMYYGGLDDFATIWQVSPRKAFESIASKFPRRFQVRADVSPGERQFARKCSVCHTLKKAGRNRAGPTLYNVFGRRAGTLKGYPYSDALKNADIVWSGETIGKLFSLGPEHFTPGSKMPLQKISNAKTRADLIDFLKVATVTGAGDPGTAKTGRDDNNRKVAPPDRPPDRPSDGQ